MGNLIFMVKWAISKNNIVIVNMKSLKGIHRGALIVKIKKVGIP